MRAACVWADCDSSHTIGVCVVGVICIAMRWHAAAVLHVVALPIIADPVRFILCSVLLVVAVWATLWLVVLIGVVWHCAYAVLHSLSCCVAKLISCCLYVALYPLVVLFSWS